MAFAGKSRIPIGPANIQKVIRDLWASLQTIKDPVPVGMLMAGVFDDKAELAGWLRCDGRTNISTQKYSSLYALFSTRYGSDGDGMFGLPDLRDALVMGVHPDSSNSNRVGTFPAIGASGSTYTAFRANWYVKV